MNLIHVASSVAVAIQIQYLKHDASLTSNEPISMKIGHSPQYIMLSPTQSAFMIYMFITDAYTLIITVAALNYTFSYLNPTHESCIAVHFYNFNIQAA